MTESSNVIPLKSENSLPETTLSIKAMVEAILFASEKPLKESDLLPILQGEDENITLKEISNALNLLTEEYQERSGGFSLECLKSLGYQFRTTQKAAPLMFNKFANKPRPLSRAAMETLSIVAYKQPVTRADVEFIRGVDAGSIIKNLIERNLIRCVGRKEDSGKPMMFGTTSEFLQVFQMAHLNDLPPLSSFQPHSEDIDSAAEKLENRDQNVDMGPYLDGSASNNEVNDDRKPVEPEFEVLENAEQPVLFPTEAPEKPAPECFSDDVNDEEDSEDSDSDLSSIEIEIQEEEIPKRK